MFLLAYYCIFDHLPCILVEIQFARMSTMYEIKKILENQIEVKYLAYFVIQDDRTGEIELNIYAADIAKKYFFKDENACLSKLIDILYELKRLETWSLARQEKSNVKQERR